MWFFRRHSKTQPRGKAVREAIERFMDTGESYHSDSGVLLAPILNHCVVDKIPFRLTYTGYDYMVQMIYVDNEKMIYSKAAADALRNSRPAQ